MLHKSKSMLAISGLVLLAIMGMIIGTLTLQKTDEKVFSEEGYVLETSAEAGNENVMVSNRLWFQSGTSWKEGSEAVVFSDTAGEQVEIGKDSFIHYANNTVTSVKHVSAMNLDQFANGMIHYYAMEPGDSIAWNGEVFTLGTGEEQSEIPTLLMKSSDTKYLLGADELILKIGNGKQLEYITSGYLELQYLSEDKEVVVVNDGTNAWQFLSSGAFIEFPNRVRLSLQNGELEILNMEGDADKDALKQRVFLDDILIYEKTTKLAETENGYPLYRFTVKDGEDGKDGEAGEIGADGEEGQEGENGDDGEDQDGGQAGRAGTSGVAGITGVPGVAGGQMSGVNVKTTVPVVTLKDWVINGKTLKFTAYMDEISCNSVVEQTTRISLVDVNSGKEVYYWDWEGDRGDTGQQIDFSEDSAEGFQLYCSALEPGHQYRMTIHADYYIEDMIGSQDLLTRTFKADDYGISFELLERDSESFTFALKSTNRLIEMIRADVTVNGADVAEMNDGNWDSYKINVKDIQTEDWDVANQTYNVSFKPVFRVTSFNSDGEPDTILVGEDGSISYDYVVSTLKKAPKVGGVRLTANESGFFLAEALGEEISEGNYAEIQDDDDSIKSIRFELYDNSTDLFKGTNPIAEKIIENGYLAYFQVSDDVNDPVHVGDSYWMRAYYTYYDGEKIVEVPVKELDTNGNENISWSEARLKRISKVTLTFRGDNTTYNTAQEAAAGENSGITFNTISGVIAATLPTENNFCISEDYPMELQISAEPDYHKIIKYDSLDDSTSNIVTLKAAGGATPGVISMFQDYSGRTVIIPIADQNINGLKADTSYMFTLYGYEKIEDTYNRVVMGSVAVETRSSKTIGIDMVPAIDTENSSIGVNFVIGGFGRSNYYNGGYSSKDAYMNNTDASYRSLDKIRFELYNKESSKWVGYCEITDDNITDTEYNTLYEKYYGVNAEKTLTEYKTTHPKCKGLLGVGKDSYMHYFLDENHTEILPNHLTSGEYYIKAVEAYDYTLYRYNVANDPNSGAGDLYDYYTYRSEMEDYVNKLSISENQEVPVLEVEALPYIVPGEDIQFSDGNEIAVEYMTNKELGKYNAAPKGEQELYSPNWKEDTIAGLKLTTKYRNDADFNTDTFTYYGFSYEKWKDINLDEKALTTVLPSENIREDNKFTFQCQIDMKANSYLEVPEVWLLFYNEDDLKYIAQAATDSDVTGIVESSGVGAEAAWDYTRTTTVGGKTVQIFYMDKEYFFRGQSYVFAYEAALSEYKYEDKNGDEYTNFIYPGSYYHAIQGINYNKGNTLHSATIPIERQAPESYSYLKSTGNATGPGTARWKVYVHDPDDAIRWKTILLAGGQNAEIEGGNAREAGGIYTLTGANMPDMDDSLQLEFEIASSRGSVRLDKKTVYDTQKLELENVLNKINDDQLSIIQETLTFRSETDEGVMDRGGEITVSNMRKEGISYQLRTSYVLLDDKDGFNEETDYLSLPLIQHNYIGNTEYGGIGNGLQFSKAELQSDKNTVRIYLNPSENDLNADNTLKVETENGQYDNEYYLTKKYQNKVRGIAAVRLTAKNASKTTIVGQPLDILERDTNGETIPNKPKELWLYPKKANYASGTDYRYYIEFKLSDLDQGNDLQYGVTDKLIFAKDVYYLTGESGGLADNMGEAFTDDLYALKFVNLITMETLAAGYDIEKATYRYTSLGTVGDTDIGAGRSLFQVRQNNSITGALPWTRSLNIRSTSFDKTYTDKAISTNVSLSNEGGYKGKTVLELMKVEKETIGFPAAGQIEDEKIEVQSAVPVFSNLEAIGGIVQANIQADVDNWNLVQYPENEDLHLYYLVYKTNIVGNAYERGALVGAMVGEPTGRGIRENGGTLDVSFTLTDTNTKNYWIDVYYKSKKAGESDTDYENAIDSNIFNNNITAGTFYTDGNASDIENVLTTGNSRFHLMQGMPNNRILVNLREGLEMDTVTLNLNLEEKYQEKTLEIVTNIVSPILKEEQDSFELVYELQRCDITKDPSVEGNWEKEIISRGGSGAAGWEYYDSGNNVNDIIRYPLKVTSGSNSMVMKFLSDGKIKPGYYYRVQTCIVQKLGGASDPLVSIVQGKHPSGYVTSNVVSWKNVSLAGANEQLLVQNANLYQTGTSISLSYYLLDSNHTSLDGNYYVRLAEKLPNGEWQVVEGEEISKEYYPEDISGNWMDKERQFGNTYHHTFGTTARPLKPSTTYRLQYYALMDTNFDNKVNIRDTDKVFLGTEYSATNILKLDTYYPKGEAGKDEVVVNNIEELKNALLKKNAVVNNQLKLGDNEVQIGYSKEITTLDSATACTVGNYQSTTINSGNEIVLHFTGAVDAGQISRITYDLMKEDTGISWGEENILKSERAESMFDTATANGNGNNGNITLKLKLGVASDSNTMNVREVGKYIMMIRFQKYNDTSKEYETVESKTITFYNSTVRN